MAEAAFLARQKERSERVTRSRIDKSLKDEAMIKMTDEIRQWKHQLALLVATRDNDNSPTNSSSPNGSYTVFSLYLSSLSDELVRIKQKCVNSDMLSASDTMLLHRQLTDCQATLSDTMQRRKPKFIFRRYRQAIDEQKKRKVDEPKSTDDKSSMQPFTAPKMESPPVDGDSNRDRCVDCISNSDIHITASTGNVRIQPKARIDGNETIQRSLPPLHALEIHTLSNCNVTLHGVYHSLILRNLIDTAITVEDSATTIHATKCHRVTLQSAQTQQVRLHQSDFVDIRNSSSSMSSSNNCNIMLEDCQSIVVYGNNNMSVNDFNWLRTDQPSPNYTHVHVSTSLAAMSRETSRNDVPSACKKEEMSKPILSAVLQPPDPNVQSKPEDREEEGKSGVSSDDDDEL